MTKVHPNTPFLESSCSPQITPTGDDVGKRDPAILTVWRKSLLFNGKGFTVFDSKGDLVFRVDNYACGNRTEIVLMDSVGKPLLSFRRKKLSLGETWMIYEGEQTKTPTFSVKKQVLQSKVLAHVRRCGGGGEGQGKWEYVVEGSYTNRTCALYDRNRGTVAEIKRKEEIGGVGFGNNVFRLVVERSEMDSAVAMAVVILLDQMCGSRG